jgi:hypothetical protein
MAGYVYLIGSRTFKWYKIGKTSKPTIRVSELGILLPFRIEVIAVWKLSNYHVMEYALHEKYTANRINGEWFTFTPKEIHEIVDEMLWASTDVAVGFSNIESDAPEGKVVKISIKKYVSPEECEMLKRKGMAESAAKRALRSKCPTCGHNTLLKTPCA